jgi:quercetin dioxygenase-like cupin family protein
MASIRRIVSSDSFGTITRGVTTLCVLSSTLKPGEVFYEAPNALHAVSRNASTTQPLKYLVIQVSDPTKPATMQE